MAIHAHSTPAPGFQRRLLRAARLLVPTDADPTHTPALTAETVAMLDALSRPEAVSVQSEPKCVAQPLLPAEPDTAAEAQALHARRELHQALDYGFALMDALGLSPLALDVIDDAIAGLDAWDAAGEDLEDDGLAEAEPDDEDDNPAEETSLETFGRGFVRCGDDDAEDDDGAGDEDSGIGDADGMGEQLAGWSHCPALQFSNGGYVG